MRNAAYDLVQKWNCRVQGMKPKAKADLKQIEERTVENRLPKTMAAV